jgi:hypothetical protein
VRSIDSKNVLLRCAREAPARRFLVHGSRPPAWPDGVPTVDLPARPDRAAFDPVLALEPRRVIVEGSDAALAAVLVRLLRAERLDVEVAFVPDRGSAAARAWGLPTGAAASALALDGTAAAVPLVRDDSGGVLAGRGEIAALHGECYCDETLVLRGSTPRLTVVPGPDGIGVRAGRRDPDGVTRPVAPMAATGQGSALGRAVQIGGEPMTVVADGVAHPRPVKRWTWFRHTSDWLLVRP